MNFKHKILVLMSGGVDSSTAAALLVREGHEVAGVYLKLWDASPRHPERLPGQAGSEGSRATWESRDSSVAALPQNDRNFLGDPCWAQEMRDAARVAAKLGIPFDVWDVTEEYKTRVLENFYSEYAAGRTPNPDVLCNSEIKFGIALERALKLGYDLVATGHYARIRNPSQPPLTLRGGETVEPPLKVRGGQGELWTAVDPNKDQSYFLWRLTPKQLAHTMFPIGEYTKPQVRALAEEFGLHNAEKKDSQGVCFLGKIDLKEFLYRIAPPPPALLRNAKRAGLTPPQGTPPLTLSEPVFMNTPSDTPSWRPHRRGGEKIFPPLPEGGEAGPSERRPRGLGGVGATVVRHSGAILDVHGTLLGFHDGLAHFTIGQRQGTKLGGTGPYFVVQKDMLANALIVANTEDEPKYRAVECRIKNAEGRMQKGECRRENAEGRMSGEIKCMARVRYRAPLVSVILRSVATKDLPRMWDAHSGEIPRSTRNDEIWRVTFNEPTRAVAPGQSIVFYDGERVLGGGVIDGVTLLHNPSQSPSSDPQFPSPLGRGQGEGIIMGGVTIANQL